MTVLPDTNGNKRIHIKCQGLEREKKVARNNPNSGSSRRLLPQANPR